MDQKSDFIVVSTTVDDQSKAEQLARLLVNERLAACVHQTPIRSIYSWKGAIEEAQEILLAAKSKASLADRLIDFIKENYKSDLTRDGLAEAAGMNTYYFSKKFSEYTGKKINDYINELRIEDALKQLKDMETSIINIAFAVGFESLSTFNRSFKAVTGQTPSAYRKELKPRG